MAREITADEGYRAGEATRRRPENKVIDGVTDAKDSRCRLFVSITDGGARVTVIGPTVEHVKFHLHEQDIDELVRALKQAQEALL